MAYTQADIDTLTARLAQLNQMLADGVRSVTIGDQSTIFNTSASLIQARDDVKTQLEVAEASLGVRKRAPRQTQLVFNGRSY